MTAITNALSGMFASMDVLNASASNTANAQSSGPVPGSKAAASSSSQVYQPFDTVEVSAGNGGGVQTTYRPKTPGYQLAYKPDSPDADGDGMIAEPSVDPVQEKLSQITSLRAFQLNASVMKAGDQMEKAAINLLA